MSINGKSFDFTYILPTWFAPILINDDWTGLNEEEEEIAINVIANELQNSNCVDYVEGSFFSKYHDAKEYGCLASDCYEFCFKEV